MIDGYKAVFLPIDDRILNLYNGFILNGTPLPDLKKPDVYPETLFNDIQVSRTERVIKIIFKILIAPIIIIVLLIAAIFNKFNYAERQINIGVENFLSIFFRTEKFLRLNRKRENKYPGAVEENIPEFLNHCKTNFVKVYLYSYKNRTQDEQMKIDNLLQLGLILSCQTISKLSDFIHVN